MTEYKKVLHSSTWTIYLYSEGSYHIDPYARFLAA